MADRTLAERARELANAGVGLRSDLRAMVTALADLCDTYREALEEATGLLHWFNTAHAGTPDYRILRQKVAEFCRVALATGEQTEAHQ